MSKTLSQCPSSLYIVVSQPGVTPSDYISSKFTPSLSSHLSTSKPNSHIRSSVSIPEVLDDIDTSLWQQTLVSKCNVRIIDIATPTGSIPTHVDSTPYLITLNFPALSPTDRERDLKENDAFLASVLDVMPSTNYTVLYTTSTRASATKVLGEAKEYAMQSEIEELLHTDLRRDLSTHQMQKRENITLPDGGLFEKYQFFTPGKSSVHTFLTWRIADCYGRYLHGPRRRLHPAFDSLRWCVRSRELASNIRGFR